MRNLLNNQLNTVTFIKSGEITTDITSASIKQLGSGNSILIPATLIDDNCFVAEIEFQITENQFANATYILEILDSLDSVIFTTTVSISGNTDLRNAYIIR